MNDASFYAAWAAHYDAVFPVGPKAAFVAARFAAPARLLDAGCATGGLAFALAGGGFSVHGIDLEPALVARAEARLAGEPHPDLSFAVGDMTAVPVPERPFDGALCLGNTLVHLLEPARRVAALASLARAVAPAGGLLVQIVNYDHVLDAGLDRLPTIEGRGVRFERRYHALSSDGLRFEALLEVPSEGLSLRVEQPLYPLRRAQLADELSASGWEPRSWFGDFRGAPLDPGSPACIVHAVRG